MGKTLKEQTLLNKFLFDATMDNQESHEALLKIIFGTDELRLLTPAQTEKEFRTAPWLRSIRVDVFSMDDAHRIFDTEMQAKYRDDLIKRSRYYQALIDSSLLAPGELNFNSLNSVFIIMITPFDLFGKGKYCYTFASNCREDKGLELADGAIRIFLNTRGTNDEEVNPELVDFLHYVETMDESLVNVPGNERLKKIHECVEKIKSSEEMGVRFMQSWEEKVIERQEGKAEGKAEAVIELLMELGTVPDNLREAVMLQTDLVVLKDWLKKAAKVDSIETFQRECGL